jgi:hypothetical protein
VINNNPTAYPDFRHIGVDKERLLLDNNACKSGKVLIVDDEIDIVSTLQTYLSKNGYKTLGCTSARGAIDAMRKYDFDLLLIDLQLPDMSGIDVLKAALNIDPHIIGIIITGKGTIESAVDAMKAGAFDFLLKPFKYELLTPILARAMKVRELSRSEDRCRSLVEELSYRVRELQKTRESEVDREVELFEMKEELEVLRESLRKYKDTEKNMFFDGNGISEY